MMQFFRRYLVVWPALLTPFLCNATAIIPAGMGVNIHFLGGHTHDLHLIAQAGLKYIRTDCTWAEIEKKKGEYEWSAQDQLIAHATAEGLRLIYVLDYSNPLYEPDVPGKRRVWVPHSAPIHPDSIAAFARWSAAAAVRFKQAHVIFEIYNEPNGAFWPPKADAIKYAELAMAAAQAIREADPQAVIIAPALATTGLGEIDLPFLEQSFRRGLLENLDGVSIHPYRRLVPETAGGDYQKVRQLMDHFAPVRRQGKIALIDSEWGYSSFPKEVSEEIQACYIVRQRLNDIMSGVPISIWYDWKDDGADPNEREHHFGLINYQGQAKPAYRLIQTFNLELAGYHAWGRYISADTNEYLVLFKNDSGSSKMVVWTAGSPHHELVSLSIRPSSTIQGHHSDGSEFTIHFIDRRLYSNLGDAPDYVDLGTNCPDSGRWQRINGGF